MRPPLESDDSRRSFTGYTRRRETTARVRIADVLARVFIGLGGVGTIIAISLVCVFLAYTVIPLFLAPSIVTVPPIALAAADTSASGTPGAEPSVEHVAIDEYRTLAWLFRRDGRLDLHRVDDGARISSRELFPGTTVSASAFALRDGHAAFGFADGTIRLGRFSFVAEFREPAEIDADLSGMAIGDRIQHDGGVLELTPERQYRHQSLQVELEEPIATDPDAAIVRIDQSIRPAGPIVASLAANGMLRISEVSRRKNLLTGKVTARLTGGEVQVALPADGSLPRWLRLSGLGDNVYLAWEDGRVLRYDTRETAEPVLAEELDLAPEPGATLTDVDFLIGKTSLVTGDSLGRVRVWFRTKPAGAETVDGAHLTLGTELPGATSAVVALGASSRTRMLAAAYADGAVRLFHVTSNRLLAENRVAAESPAIHALVLGSKDDALYAFASGRVEAWQVDAPHPESTLAAIFVPVWYEGYEVPAHVWQSSSGTDDFEPKYGIYPLVFGTLKATLYSMLFGLPLALLAAIYTSEFMRPRLKAKVKPTIELMASLPSVVLGFLAALVIAPFIEDVVLETILCLGTIPFALLIGACLWQMVPEQVAPRLRSLRLPAMFACVPLGIGLASLLAPFVERVAYAGDLKAWLAGQHGSGFGGWILLLVPLAAALTGIAMARYVNPWLRHACGGMPRRTVSWISLGKVLAGTALVLLIATALSSLLSALGFDPRGSFVDTYVQRNAMVVGFIMGFAIIPIIYTIADDALSAVPEHLRAASLGAGATVWQTTMRVVVPTAMSGLFSATMIGLGRAVGETMIVLMAAGNTPVMDWNIFNGFRTLSANIAVELPEAVQNSTHYRMLFLAALSLFAITFAVNTVAEIIRMRFRKRAYQL